ncbi:MAG: peptide chain release factor N(5)-glutamine methyltransferase [Alphaproteobacteria bacterium]|nr:peptide chain release factor N(5)-glutamine methyltransferase [Alphaproteobacteria bacterium]
MANGLTRGQALTEAAAQLSSAGLETARLDARLLLGYATGITQEALIGYPERAVDGDALARYRTYIERRARHEPLAYVTGEKEFWGLTLGVTAHTLIPRPDSETLVAVVLDALPDRNAPWRILDLGTGSGCLLLALLKELPNARGVGVDIDPSAVTQAARNAQVLGMESRSHWHVGCWAEGVSGPFDIVISNPPYIPAAAITALAPEVAEYEPHLALDGGVDGLICYRQITAELDGLLAPGGIAAFEFGIGQGAAVRDIGIHAGLRFVTSAHDLAGIERCVVFSTNVRKA